MKCETCEGECEIIDAGDAEECCLCGNPSECCKKCYDRHENQKQNEQFDLNQLIEKLTAFRNSYSWNDSVPIHRHEVERMLAESK